MSSIGHVRAIALALPEVTESDHHGMASFRVRGKIFATVPDDEHVRIMLDENGIRSAVAEEPLICDEFYWGKKLACVVVAVKPATTSLLQELLIDAWLLKAPVSLTRRVGETRSAETSALDERGR
ncbi:MmcQ/YjbR family DNA-binding protein [Mycobacterium sp.]|uniref:MmcQ/YjbR family DNA-binding protein n=1 Tax=Mycobacterium sp. TaxID=1785 RepID=UPI003CC5EB48